MKTEVIAVRKFLITAKSKSSRGAGCAKKFFN